MSWFPKHHVVFWTLLLRIGVPCQRLYSPGVQSGWTHPSIAVWQLRPLSHVGNSKGYEKPWGSEVGVQEGKGRGKNNSLRARQTCCSRRPRLGVKLKDRQLRVHRGDANHRLGHPVLELLYYHQCLIKTIKETKPIGTCIDKKFSQMWSLPYTPFKVLFVLWGIFELIICRKIKYRKI